MNNPSTNTSPWFDKLTNGRVVFNIKVQLVNLGTPSGVLFERIFILLRLMLGCKPRFSLHV